MAEVRSMSLRDVNAYARAINRARSKAEYIRKAKRNG